MMRTNRKLRMLVAYGLLGLLFLAINTLAGVVLRSARLDLTAQGLYSLSPGTREILAKIDEPLTLRFFFSRTLANEFPQTRSYGQRVGDLLKEIALVARGKVLLEVIEPEPFSPAEDRAVALGLTGLAAGRGEKLYFGVSGINLLDGRYAIPFFTREREQFLEYDIAKMIDSLNQPDRPRVGIVTSLPIDTGPGGVQAALRGLSKPYAIYEELRSLFDIEMLSSAMTSVAGDFDVLLLANPPDFDDLATYALDQFVLRGGKLIVLVDPYSEVSLKPGPQGVPDRAAHTVSSFEPLLSQWGVEFQANQIVLDRGRAQRVGIDRDGEEFIDYPAWIALGPDNVDKDDPVTANISTLNLASVGYLSVREAPGISAVPLIWSSADAMIEDAASVRGRPDPKAMARNFNPTGERYTLALRLSGALTTAFPDGPPPLPAGLDQSVRTRPPHLAQSTQPANIIILADSDLLDDRFWVSRGEIGGRPVLVPVADNANFLLNAVDNLTGSGALISLRSRGVQSRPFVRINKLRRQAETRFLAEQEALQSRLKEVEQRLAEQQSSGTDTRGARSAAEKAEAAGFRQELLQTRESLREVRRNLNADVEQLKSTVRRINIGLVPAFLAALFLGLAAWRWATRRSKPR